MKCALCKLLTRGRRWCWLGCIWLWWIKFFDTDIIFIQIYQKLLFNIINPNIAFIFPKNKGLSY